MIDPIGKDGKVLIRNEDDEWEWREYPCNGFTPAQCAFFGWLGMVCLTLFASSIVLLIAYAIG